MLNVEAKNTNFRNLLRGELHILNTEINIIKGQNSTLNYKFDTNNNILQISKKSCLQYFLFN